MERGEKGNDFLCVGSNRVVPFAVGERATGSRTFCPVHAGEGAVGKVGEGTKNVCEEESDRDVMVGPDYPSGRSDGEVENETVNERVSGHDRGPNEDLGFVCWVYLVREDPAVQAMEEGA